VFDAIIDMMILYGKITMDKPFAVVRNFLPVYGMKIFQL
jgi:hypothetical protein